MERRPRVTVIIPTFNRSAWLKEAVYSVANQTFTNIELIVADDGSDDDTPEIVSQFPYPVRHLRLAHSGRPSVVRNRALDASRGDLVAFLDDDDLWVPEKLEEQVALFERRPQLDFVYCDARAVNAAGQLSGPLLSPPQKQPERLFDALLASCFIYPSTIMASRQRLLAAGGFDESLPIVEDYDLWLRLAYQGRAGFVPASAVTVRRHEQGISARRRRQTAEGTIRVLTRVWRDMQLTGRQRLLLRRSLARSHTHLALFLCEAGELPEARQHFRRAVRWNPLRPRAWLEMFKLWLAQ
ncbi:MAG: glycosyltransferase [Chloroflexota bacterium]